MSIMSNGALVAHIAAGTVALATGLLPIFVSKGGALHRRAGRWFLRAMSVVLGSAAMLTLLAYNPYFAALTIGAGISTFSGVRVLRRKRPDIDPAQRAKPLDWAVTIGAIATLVFLGLLALQGEQGHNATVFYSLLVGAGIYAVYDVWRFLFPAAWPFFPRLWFYEHLVKMLASCSAVVAAFSGSVLYFLPIAEPWKQLWPTLLFHNLMIGFILWYAIFSKWRRAVPA